MYVLAIISTNIERRNMKTRPVPLKAVSESLDKLVIKLIFYSHVLFQQR